MPSEPKSYFYNIVSCFNSFCSVLCKSNANDNQPIQYQALFLRFMIDVITATLDRSVNIKVHLTPKFFFR